MKKRENFTPPRKLSRLFFNKLHFFCSTHLHPRELMLVAERRIEERGQMVNPLVGLRLAHPEEQTLHRLDGIEPEID